MHESSTLLIDYTQYISSQQQQQHQQQLQGPIDKHFENDSTYKSSSDSDENNKRDANNDWNFCYSETRDNEEQQKKVWTKPALYKWKWNLKRPKLSFVTV